MTSKLFEALDAEWVLVSDNARARLLFGRWTESEPALAGLGSPAGALRCCKRADRTTAARVLGALMRQAADPLAARTLLQAVLPSLRSQVSRRSGGTGRLPRGEGWESGDDYAADVVEAAVRRIAALAGTSPEWPAQAICESTWNCLRGGVRRSARIPTPVALIDVAGELAAGSIARTGAEELALAVKEAVDARWLTTAEARVIYVTRVLGHSTAEVAAVDGRDVRAVRAQRSRAERRLVRAGWPPARGMAPRYSVERTAGRSDVPTTDPIAV